MTLRRRLEALAHYAAWADYSRKSANAADLYEAHAGVVQPLPAAPQVRVRHTHDQHPVPLVPAREEAMIIDAQARAEDIRWMVQTGENLTGAARRLGLTNCGLEEWCKDNGLRNEATILRSRDPRDHNARGIVGRLA